MKERKALIPKKYDNMSTTKKQIPLKSIKILLEALSTGLHYNCTLEDMVNFVIDKNLTLEIPYKRSKFSLLFSNCQKKSNLDLLST